MSSELKELNCLLSALKEYACWHYSVFRDQDENRHLFIAPLTKITLLQYDIKNLTASYFSAKLP